VWVPVPPLPPSPPLRPFGLLRGHCRATLALLWLCHNHYCTPGGGLKTVMLVPPPPANRLYSSYVTLISIPLVIVSFSNSWNKYFYCLLFYCLLFPYFSFCHFLVLFLHLPLIPSSSFTLPTSSTMLILSSPKTFHT
jgi:hypothetical protein